MQGGKQAHGCGNHWLFSCCVAELKVTSTTTSISAPTTTLTVPIPPLTIVKQQRHKIKLKQSLLQPPSGSAVSGSGVGLNKNQILKRRLDDQQHYQQQSQHSYKSPIACGVQPTMHNTLRKRIIGGREAQFAEYPWQAHIRIAEFQCGGVLVSRRFVATAAHCIQAANIKEITIYLGELDTQNSGYVSEPLPAEKHRVTQKIIHPRFQFRMTQPDRFDIALLRLSRPAGFRSHILPICLPSQPLDLSSRHGIIAGWGKTDANVGHTGTNILRSASVPIINTKECIRWHESKNINVELFGEMICAGHQDGNQDACLGDSGGPLITKVKDRYTLIGITSAGFGCGVDHQPGKMMEYYINEFSSVINSFLGIYHNVQLTTNWVKDVIGDKY